MEKHDSDAYRLLCRLGCYRYQEIPSVPIDGVSCLLWDVAKENHKRVIKSLQDRSLVESKKGEYWLHPVIREESRNELNGNLEWKLANYQAGDFWIARCITEKVLKDHPFVLQFFLHLFEHSLDEQETQEVERILGIRLVESELLDYLGELGEFHYNIGLIIQRFSSCINHIRLIIQNLSSYLRNNIEDDLGIDFIRANVGDYRYNFEAAIEIFNKLGETEEAEKVKWAMENGGEPYETAIAFYRFGLNYQESGKLEVSNWLFKMAIRLFKEIEAYEEAEEVRRAMESVE